jgi:adenine phosphoribosyltransferase
VPSAEHSLEHDVVERIAWVDGHADVWRVFADADLLARCIAALAVPYRDDDITHVVSVEARGFLLGGAVAHALGAGFVGVRKPSGHLPGEALTAVTDPDYKGEATELRLQASVLPASARVLVVDDWFESGSQFMAVRSLIERAGARLVGASVLVDQTPPALGPHLGKYRYVVRADDLADPPAVPPRPSDV